MSLETLLCSEQYPQQIVLFEKVLCRSTELLFVQHENTNWSRLMASEITCSLKEIKQCRQMTPLCCVGTVGWGGSSLEE